VLEAAEVADDARQRRRHDRLVQRRQQHPEHQPGEHDQRAAAAEQVRTFVAQRNDSSRRYV
jgi:hypothetical protein